MAKETERDREFSLFDLRVDKANPRQEPTSLNIPLSKNLFKP